MNLFIIGNGFSIANKIPSSFKEFGNFLGKKDFETYKNIVDIIGINNFSEWNELETKLYDITPQTVAFCNIAIRMDSTYYQHDVIDKIIEMYDCFFDWILSLSNLKINKIDLYSSLFTLDDLFLDFNYLPDVEQYLPNISKLNICHIHGLVKNEVIENDIILGHKVVLNNEYRNLDKINPKAKRDYDFYTIKNTNEIIEKNKYFFDLIRLNANLIQNVYLIGTSMTDCDLPYLKEIIKDLSTNRNIKYFFYNLQSSIDRVKYLENLLSIKINFVKCW